MSSLRRALDELARERAANNSERALALIRTLRPVWHEAVMDALRERGPEGACDVIRRMFLLGVFDFPPLSGPPYQAWRLLRVLERGHGSGDAREPQDNAGKPFFSLLMPVYNPRPEFLEAALNSVLAQSCPLWELCLVDDASSEPAVRAVIVKYAACDSRIRVHIRERNGHISEASNNALAMARGAWCVLVDHDDLLPERALSSVRRAIKVRPDADVFFSDEDRVEDNGDGPVFTSPLFKFGFDPYLLLAHNVVSHLGVYRTTALREEGGFRQGLEGAQDHDLALRIWKSRGEKAFCHIPDVLYHWRRHEGSTSLGGEVKPYAARAAMRARVDAVGRDYLFLPRESGSAMDVRFVVKEPQPSLSLIVLADPLFLARSDEEIATALRQLRGKLGQTAEMVMVPICGTPEDIAEGVAGGPARPAEPEPNLERLRKRHDLGDLLIPQQPSLPWPEAVNRAVLGLSGEAVALLRAGDMPLNPGWARQPLAGLMEHSVAVTGCRTLNANGFVLQSGYAVGEAPVSMAADMFGQRPGIPASAGQFWLCPAYAGLHASSAGYYAQAHLLRRVPAVYASGMFFLAATHRRLAGFCSGSLPLADADFCLRALKAGLGLSLVIPAADLESPLGPQPRQVTQSMKTMAAMTGLLAGHEPSLPGRHPWLDWTAGGWRLRAK